MDTRQQICGKNVQVRNIGALLFWKSFGIDISSFTNIIKVRTKYCFSKYQNAAVIHLSYWNAQYHQYCITLMTSCRLKRCCWSVFTLNSGQELCSGRTCIKLCTFMQLICCVLCTWGFVNYSK